VKIRLNGAAREVGEGVTLDRLVADLALDGSVIAVEINRAVVKRGAYPRTRLEPGDEVEIVTLVGGG
jgi:thiamine biosynthesis protein ThiS